MQRFTIVFTAINLMLLLLTVVQSGRTIAQTVPPVLRGQALELVDDHGQGGHASIPNQAEK